MGTSLSGLTPATTFDGLLKTSDNEPLGGALKIISDGSGVDSVLQLSNSALKVNGGQATILGAGNSAVTTALLIQNSDGLTLLKASDDRNLFLGSSSNYIHQGMFFQGNYRAVGDWSFGTTNAQTAKVGIKGSGSTSATTSLLVQNSAGADSLKITDDNNVLIGNSTTGGIHNVDSASSLPFTVSRLGIVRFSVSSDSGNGQIVLKSNTNNEFSVGTNGNIFQINDGANTNQGSKRFSIIQDGNVGIGDVIPTAKLQVKGSGNDNTTTALLVQNSDGTELMKVQDDGATTLNSSAANALIIDSTIGTSGFEMQAQGQQKFRIQASGSTTRFTTNNTGGLAFLGNGIFTGGAFDIPAARLHVKGSGATSATTALLVENSAGTEHLKVTDDGVTNVRLSLVVNHPSVSSRSIGLSWGAIGATSTTDELSLYGGGSTSGSIVYLNASGKTAAPAVIGMKTNGILVASAMVQSSFAPDASAQLQVDSTTKGFLPPRMAEGERDAISSPASGLMIYNTDTDVAECWNGSAWMAMF